MSLLEENARILAGIEPDWSDLGPLRRINFALRFNDYSERDSEAITVEDQVARFLEFARHEGCECIVSLDQYGDASVCAFKTMAPTAENVTSLQERLQSFTDEFPCAYVDGWHYPPKKTVVFWPKRSASTHRTAQARAEILFDGKLVDDPISSKNTHQESDFGRIARDPARSFRLFNDIGEETVEKPDNVFRFVPS